MNSDFNLPQGFIAIKLQRCSVSMQIVWINVNEVWKISGAQYNYCIFSCIEFHEGEVINVRRYMCIYYNELNKASDNNTHVN